MIILEHGHNFSHNDLENNGIMSQGKKKSRSVSYLQLEMAHSILLYPQ